MDRRSLQYIIKSKGVLSWRKGYGIKILKEFDNLENSKK